MFLLSAFFEGIHKWLAQSLLKLDSKRRNTSLWHWAALKNAGVMLPSKNTAVQKSCFYFIDSTPQPLNLSNHHAGVFLFNFQLSTIHIYHHCGLIITTTPFFHLEHRVSLLSRINQKCSQCINMYQKTRAYCTYPSIFATCWLPVGPWLCFWHPMCRRTPWGHKMPLSWWSLNPDKKTKVLKTHFYTEAFLWTSVLLCRTNLVLGLQINEENASVFSIDCSVCFWERNKIALLHFTSVLQYSLINAAQPT